MAHPASRSAFLDQRQHLGQFFDRNLARVRQRLGHLLAGESAADFGVLASGAFGLSLFFSEPFKLKTIERFFI